MAIEDLHHRGHALGFWACVSEKCVPGRIGIAGAIG